MIDESDDVTTWRFHRVSRMAVIGSALLHATALAALLPETLPRQERLSEQADGTVRGAGRADGRAGRAEAAVRRVGVRAGRSRARPVGGRISANAGPG